MFSSLFIFVSCGGTRAHVEKIVEGGIEVVINHLEPYNVGQKSSLVLEEIFKIDTERDEIANPGMTNIQGFEVNSQGDILCLRALNGSGNFVYKFDKNGKFVKSFGYRGQGPGEVQQPHSIYLDHQDNIVIVDIGRYPLNIYDKNGSFIGGREIARNAGKISSGPRTSSLILESTNEPATGEYQFTLKLLNADLKEVAILDRYRFKFEQERLRVIEPLFCWSASRDDVFVANEERDYEIWVYDFNGTLVRKIRKQNRRVSIDESDKTEILNHFPQAMRPAAYFPEFYPSIRGIVAGEDGTLLVSTFEKGDRPGDFMFDVFNPEGVFVGRKSLNAFVWENHLFARIREDRFYGL